MLVVPGGPGFAHDPYIDFLLPFSQFVNILFYDPRGRGKSQAPEDLEGYQIGHEVLELHDLVEALREKLDFKQLILHGTSYGSMVAQGYAGKFPEKLSKLILVAGAPSHEFLPLAKKELAKRGDAEQKSICEKGLWPGNFDEKSLEEFSFQTSTLYSYTTKEKILRYHSNECSIPILNRAFRELFDQFDFTDRLSHIHCPTLILAGRYDWINPPVLAEKIHQYVKESQLVVFENSGHSMPRDEPKVYFDVIANFFKN